MMIDHYIRDPRPLSESIEAAIARHGALRVLTATLRAALKRKASRPPPPSIAALNAHLRRDVGLPPEPRPQPRAVPPSAGLF